LSGQIPSRPTATVLRDGCELLGGLYFGLVYTCCPRSRLKISQARHKGLQRLDFRAHHFICPIQGRFDELNPPPSLPAGVSGSMVQS
jgi:hypothetical protein